MHMPALDWCVQFLGARDEKAGGTWNCLQPLCDELKIMPKRGSCLKVDAESIEMIEHVWKHKSL